jgi:hypothetical protein
MRWLHAGAALLWVAALAYQVYLAGQAISNLGGSGNFESHAGFGFTIGIVQLLVVLLAAAARMPRRDVGIAIGILVLYIVQTILPGAKDSTPAIAALHPLNAVILFTVSIWYARRAWRAAMAPATPPAGTATAAEPAEAKVG